MSLLLFRASSGLLSAAVQAEHRSDREVTMWPTSPWAFSLTGNLTLSLGMFAETDNEGKRLNY